ncbi:hypothetical protein RhiirA5_406761 [Rhizophagus irregularis]|uniref:Uncharacterized protein n=1 Tax=Rhizophagus irregularis TaxID=588596 RepID=A0A2N0QC80_9GLOM|nr:hypothetical protein RhiirA5_406761 [Rhizophagus irregularis]
MSVAYSDENMDFSWSICIILSDICDIAIIELYKKSKELKELEESEKEHEKEGEKEHEKESEKEHEKESEKEHEKESEKEHEKECEKELLKAFERFELIELRVILGINKQQKFNDTTIWIVENVLVTGNSVVKGDETYMKEVVKTGKSYNLIVDIDPSENMTEILANGILKLLIDCKISCYCFEFYYSTRTLGNKTNKTIIYEMVTVFIEQNQFECLSLEQPLLRIPNAKWFSDNYKEPSSSPVSQPLADNSAKRTKVTAYSTMDQDIIIPPD